MLRLARRAHPENNVKFSESTKALEADSADLIYSTFVLQHLTEDQVDRCFREFARVLHPKGLLIFQYPARPRWTLPGVAFLLLPTAVLNSIQRRILHYPGIMPMSWVAPRKIALRAAACDLVLREHEKGPAYSSNWEDIWYFAQKRSKS